MGIDSVGTSDGKTYTTIPSRMGVEMCCLRAVTENTLQSCGGIVIGSNIQKNDRALYYEVVKTGEDVYDICGVKAGDYVFVDALARFADTTPISFINCRNIIMKTDEKGEKLDAVSYKVIARIVEPTSEKNEFGFISLSQIDPYGEIVSIGNGCIDRGYKVGDHITVSSEADLIMFRGQKYFIYDFRVPISKFVEVAK